MNNVETPNKKKPRCQFISKIGSRCHADPQTGKRWCFFHDPEQKKKQAEARKQGGEARSHQTETEVKLPPNLPIVRLETSGNVFDLLVDTVYHLQCGKMDVRAARALAYLSSLLLRALKADSPIVSRLLADTINQLRRGQTALQVAKTIGHLAAIMLTALKQEVQEGEAAALMMMQAAVPAESTRPAQAISTEAPSPEQVKTVITPTVAAQVQDDHNDHKVHPAVINGNAVNTADRGGIQVP